MTEQEAIKQLKNMFPKKCKTVNGRLKGGFDDLESDGGKAILLAISALEKQIAKKPKKMEYKPLVDFGWEYACPSCGCAVGKNQHDDGEFTDKDDFCASCGQKLDWSEI